MKVVRPSNPPRSKFLWTSRAAILTASTFLLGLFLPSLIKGQGPLLLIATSASQPIQNRRADADNLSRMRNVSMIRRFRKNGLLIPVPVRTRYYYLHAVSRNYRYLRPWAKVFLDRLSRQHYARFRRRLRVTSLIRTVAFQRSLARRNGNAAAFSGPLRSSHLTGSTLDISKHGMAGESISWMRKVLYSLKKNGYLYAIEEFQQPTFHIMVYHRYENYVKRHKAIERKKKNDRPAERIASDNHSSDG
ncbi:MAG TPA: DUF5715 family protein [Bryobacteraceae bacterium]|nr:DUF5715 family protein [Bryobacteraceae bacterium]